MTTEEKARAYDEALERARKMLNMILDNELLGFPDQIREIFPQLRESEDERIRKEIVNFFKNFKETGTWKSISDVNTWIAYLEKQKEEEGYEAIPVESTLEYKLGFKAGKESEKQKEQDNEEGDFTIYHPLKNGKGKYECIPYSFYGSLTSFSEDKDLIDFLRTCFYTKEECNEWIEKQKEQKPEWSDEDERKLQKCIKIVERWEEDYDIAYAPYSGMLKSLRPHWKPSEEQMHGLAHAINLDVYDVKRYGLDSLYNDLKKLI